MNYRLLPTLLFSMLLAQTTLSNEQLDLLRDQLSQGSEIADSNILTQEENNLTNEDFEEVTIEVEEDVIPFNNDFYFGYSYFENEINFFDNTPISADYRLGAGDEIILSLWGEVNSREKITINKEGLIYFENLGFINVSNMTLAQAEKFLKDRLQNIYSTLKEDIATTDLMIEVSNLKSINVYLSGEVQSPGVHLVHPFSDIFSALIQSGGPTLNGSLREIQLIRNGEIISSTDLYTFFNSGLGNFSSQKLLNGDVINVPPVGIRVLAEGELNNLGYYELLANETINSLINYAGGLTSNSSNKVIINEIIPMGSRTSDDAARTGKVISLSNASKIFLNNGSTINILPISDNTISVKVFGRVNFPGEYPLYKNLFSPSKEQQLEALSLKELLSIVGGFEDPVFRKTINDEIVVLRQDENQFYAKEFVINYADSDNFKLNINDKVFVYENSNYENSFTYTIGGEVNRPGTYPLNEGTTLKDAIQIANGISPMGSINSISVSKDFESFDLEGNAITETALVGNIDLSFEIADKNIITILPKTNVVSVDGNVYNPGFIAHSSSMSMSRAIELAGGYKPNSLKKNAYVVRANGEIEKADLFRGRAKRVFPGDAIFVPVDPNPSQFDVTSFTSDILSVLTNIAAILVIVDNNSD
jgi:protein involved in polysaccharide export with SLBB domain